MKNRVFVVLVGAMFEEILARLGHLIAKKLDIETTKICYQTNIAFFAELFHPRPSNLVLVNYRWLLSGHNLHHRRRKRRGHSASRISSCINRICLENKILLYL